MGSYASQINTRQRWMVIAYIKSKQAAAKSGGTATAGATTGGAAAGTATTGGADSTAAKK